MGPWALAGLFAGAGALKSQLIDKPREDRDRKLRAAEIRYSPWTRLQQFTQPREADPLGSALQFGSTGAMLGQGMQNQASQSAFTDALTKRMGTGSVPPISVSPWTLNTNSFWNRPSY